MNLGEGEFFLPRLLHSSLLPEPPELRRTKKSSPCSTAFLTFLLQLLNSLFQTLTPPSPTVTPPTPESFTGLEPAATPHTHTHRDEMRSGSVAELGQDVMGSNALPLSALSTTQLPDFK